MLAQSVMQNPPVEARSAALAVAKMRAGGFTLAIENDGLAIVPASRLTADQRAYICAHKVLLLEELRAEAANDAPLVEKADPHMDRVVELIALGWAPWNAQARAESEALPGREVRV